MKYQDLLDKYSNSNYNSRGSLNVPNYITPTHQSVRSSYATELDQLQRSNHQRNRSRNRTEINPIEPKGYASIQNSPRKGEEKTMADISKDSIFKNQKQDNPQRVRDEPSPHRPMTSEDLRKTTGTELNRKSKLERDGSQSYHTTLLPPSTGHAQDYNLPTKVKSRSKNTSESSGQNFYFQKNQDIHAK